MLRSLQSDAGLFPYPAGMVGILAFFKMILTPIIGQLPLINSDLLLFRIPLLCADFIILYVMTKMSVRYTKKVIILLAKPCLNLYHLHTWSKSTLFHWPF